MAINSKCEKMNECETIKNIKLAIEKLTSVKEIDSSSRLCLLKDIEASIINFDQDTANDNWYILIENLIKVLFEFLKDKSEKCRELSAKILCRSFDFITNIEFCVPYISTTFVQKLSKSDERESSEEVRLLEMLLIYKIIDKFDGDCLKYMNDLANILCTCIIDEYPEVKRKSCDCVSLLSQKQQSNFHMISSSLLKPLLITISHQHFRTRAVCIKTIGHVVCHGNSKDFEEASIHIAQRLFDHSPVVRTAATEVIGQWLLILNDRYSFYNRLIPLMLSTLHDKVPEIRLKGQELWNMAGDQYLRENENSYKDLMDFPRPNPENYPPNVQRPTLGCRILVQRNLHSILPALIRDLTDWVLETRMKSAQVLYSLILHAEDKATIQLSSIINGIVSAAKDEDKEVKETATCCAEMLGFFLDSNLLCDSIMTLVHKSPSALHLHVFAAVLRGNKSGLSIRCFEAICKFLSEKSICRLRQAEEQANLLLCVEAVLLSHNTVDQVVSYQIFSILCTISGLTTNNSIAEKALSLLTLLASEQSKDLVSLFRIHSMTLVNSLIANNEIWTSQNSELAIFYFIIQFEYTSEDVLLAVIPVLTNNLNLNKDVKLRSKIFTLIIKIFKRLPSTEDNELSEKIVSLIHLGVFPNLTWAPGKSAGSLRTIAVASLYEIISKDCINELMLKSISKELLPILATLSDDDEVTNRLLACKIIEFLLPKLYGCIDDLKIHTTCHDFLKCMDDGSNDIRILATRVLKAYIKTFPKDYNWSSYRSYLKEIYQNVLIHMDDKNEQIRDSVFNLLKDIAFAEPQLLLDEIEKKKYMMVASSYCEDLLDHIKKLHV